MQNKAIHEWNTAQLTVELAQGGEESGSGGSGHPHSPLESNNVMCTLHEAIIK